MGRSVDAPRGAYRIRWANVQCSNGRQFSRQRMCIAERKGWLGIWWPVMDADWRFGELNVCADIARDRMLRQPLPSPRILD